MDVQQVRTMKPEITYCECDSSCKCRTVTEQLQRKKRKRIRAIIEELEHNYTISPDGAVSLDYIIERLNNAYEVER